jgi:hypothetical protein
MRSVRRRRVFAAEAKSQAATCITQNGVALLLHCLGGGTAYASSAFYVIHRAHDVPQPAFEFLFVHLDPFKSRCW